MRTTLLIATSILVLCDQTEGAKLPKGVVLPPGVVVPDDFELPDDIVIPEGFVITQDMVDQFMRYMQNEQNDAAEEEDDLWFKQLSSSHENTNLQMNVQKIDTAGANEEALFQEKLEESIMSKEVILPILAIVVVCIAVWAFMTKCGKKSCCKKNGKRTLGTHMRKSVKSSIPAVTSEDLEVGCNGEAATNTEVSQVGSGGKFNGSVVEKKFGSGSVQKADEIHSIAMPFDRASEPNKASSSMIVGANKISQRQQQRSSNLFAPVTSTANRLSLPTVSVPIDQIKSVRSRTSGSNDAGSAISRPSLPQLSARV